MWIIFGVEDGKLLTLNDYQKRKQRLICVDSDGCVMNTMSIKHVQCFGPCLVREWELWQFEADILARWNELNLYTLTRGINRFKGLALLLREIDKRDHPIAGVEDIVRFAECSPELSSAALKREIERRPHGLALKKALAWSNAVNRAVDALPMSAKMPFQGAKEGLAYAHSQADVAVVSSANFEAIIEEWRHWDLLQYVDVVCAQESGGKAECLQRLTAKGYGQGDVLMCGDAPADLQAARSAGVAFYPILAGREEESWAAFPAVVDAFLSGGYEREQQERCYRFLENLRGSERG